MTGFAELSDTVWLHEASQIALVLHDRWWFTLSADGRQILGGDQFLEDAARRAEAAHEAAKVIPFPTKT